MLFVDQSLNLGNRATSRASTLSGSVKVTFVVLGLRASFGSDVERLHPGEHAQAVGRKQARDDERGPQAEQAAPAQVVRDGILGPGGFIMYRGDGSLELIRAGGSLR